MNQENIYSNFNRYKNSQDSHYDHFYYQREYLKQQKEYQKSGKFTEKKNFYKNEEYVKNSYYFKNNENIWLIKILLYFFSSFILFFFLYQILNKRQKKIYRYNEDKGIYEEIKKDNLYKEYLKTKNHNRSKYD